MSRIIFWKTGVWTFQLRLNKIKMCRLHLNHSEKVLFDRWGKYFSWKLLKNSTLVVIWKWEKIWTLANRTSIFWEKINNRLILPKVVLDTTLCQVTFSRKKCLTFKTRATFVHHSGNDFLLNNLSCRSVFFETFYLTKKTIVQFE